MAKTAEAGGRVHNPVTRPVRVPIANLVEDFSVYPRHAVDSAYISDLARAIQAGDALPPVIVDKKSRRIVDGFHRTRAHRKVYGAGAEIDVIYRSYTSEADLLKDAVRLNATNGRKLDQQDRTRSALMLEREGVPVGEISVVLHTTETRVVELLARVVVVKPKTGGQDERHPAKPVTYPAAGQPPREISEEQLRIQASSSGLRTAQTVSQLTRELEGGLIDLSSDSLRASLWRLHDVIDGVVPRP